MKISVLNNCDIEGGAARAAFRICEGIRGLGADVSMLVQHKDSDRHWVIGPEGRFNKIASRILPHLDLLPLMRYPARKKAYWSLNWLPNPAFVLDRINAADVVHLNWVGGGYAPIAALRKIRRPIVWTLHDTWGYTGGCHSTAGCDNFTKSCGSCPQLGSMNEKDLSRTTWSSKRRNWVDVPFTLVAPSQWLAGEARRSSLFAGRRVEVIPNGIDLNVFRPIDKLVARRLLNLPEHGPFILFGAINSTSDNNKGYDCLQEALLALSSDPALTNATLLVFGASEPKNPIPVGFPVRFFGRLHDDIALALLYSAADVMVVPSRQEAFGQTASEAMACGTAVVAFAATGLLDIVDHLDTGYLAQPFDPADLARGIKWVVEDSTRCQQLAANGRRKCEKKFDISLVAQQYLDLYRSVL